MTAYIEIGTVPQTFGLYATEVQSTLPEATHSTREQSYPNIDARLFVPVLPS